MKQSYYDAHEKEYVVKVNRPIYQEMLDKMEKGVYLKELKTTTRPCKVKKLSKDTFLLQQNHFPEHSTKKVRYKYPRLYLRHI